MGNIIQLPRHLADLIAAGEVVERPASVVKELAENAFDAGAAAVTIEIRDGGLTSIRVSDDGCGIARDDVPTAFLRHATSKLKDARGLEAIETLGFRGEALAAISSVSRIEIITRADNEGEGTRAVFDGGELALTEPCARAQGTTITVRDLFYNVPARQKFMKSDRAEAAAVTQAAIRLALSRPDIAVRYSRDGAEELHTPGDSRIDSCVYAALGREFMAGMLPAELDGGSVRVRGFVSGDKSPRGNRNYQFFFINGRCVRSRTLQAALEQAYRGRMVTGRFPACVLYVEAGANTLDVNVHPAKTEVRFLYEKHVFDCVYQAALAAINGGEIAVSAAAPQQQHIIPERERNPASAPSFGAREGFTTRVPAYPEARRAAVLRDGAKSAYGTGNTARDIFAEPEINSIDPPVPQTESIAPESPATQTELADMPETRDWRVVGEAMETYIIVESRGSLRLIDKHAAHERLHYDRLLAGGYDPMPQALMEPLIIRFIGGGAELLVEHAELLDSLGFGVEPFGIDAVAVRWIPSALDAGGAEAALCDIERELRVGAADPRHNEKLFASIACRSAIKAGRESGAREREELARRVMRGEVTHCPHGRPVMIEITKAYLDKRFERI